jgi:hypothetical protein
MNIYAVFNLMKVDDVGIHELKREVHGGHFLLNTQRFCGGYAYYKFLEDDT